MEVYVHSIVIATPSDYRRQYLHRFCKRFRKPWATPHNRPSLFQELIRLPRYADTSLHARHALWPRRNLQHSRISTAVLLPVTWRKVSASALYNLRGCIASRFRIAALVLHCLRLNLTSRLRLQGCVPAVCWALPGPDFHRTILSAPNWRILTLFYIISIIL